jgi:hypothetical protein
MEIRRPRPRSENRLQELDSGSQSPEVDQSLKNVYSIPDLTADMAMELVSLDVGKLVVDKFLVRSWFISSLIW